jgi:hypothetical protein
LFALVSLKVIMKRVAHGKIRYLILCETVCTSWLYFGNRLLLMPYWWFSFALGFASLALLAILESRTGLPLPFVNHLTTDDFLKVFIIAFGLSAAIMVIAKSAHLCLQEQSILAYFDMVTRGRNGTQRDTRWIRTPSPRGIPERRTPQRIQHPTMANPKNRTESNHRRMRTRFIAS